MGLGSGVAVAVAGSCNSDSTLAWEPPYAPGAAIRRKRKKEKNRKERCKTLGLVVGTQQMSGNDGTGVMLEGPIVCE